MGFHQQRVLKPSQRAQLQRINNDTHTGKAKKPLSISESNKEGDLQSEQENKKINGLS